MSGSQGVFIAPSILSGTPSATQPAAPSAAIQPATPATPTISGPMTPGWSPTTSSPYAGQRGMPAGVSALSMLNQQAQQQQQQQLQVNQILAKLFGGTAQAPAAQTAPAQGQSGTAQNSGAGMGAFLAALALLGAR